MTIQMDDKYLKIVAQVLRRHGLKNEIYAFGSRTRGDHGKYSDLDIVIKSSISIAEMTAIKNDLAESQLPITVDIVVWDQISDEFKKKISTELVLLPF